MNSGNGFRKWAVRVVFASLLACLNWSTTGAEVKEVRIGHFPNLTHAQALYARANGDFQKAIEVPIKWISFNAGPSAIEALFSDSVDLTFVGPNPAINGYLKSRGTKFVIIAGAAGGGAGLVVRKDSGIQSEADFHGKTIATPQLGNTQDVAARIWFAEKHYLLKEKGGDLGLVALSNPDQLTMFRKKQIDGAWTVEPWVSRLEIDGGGTLFLEEKTLWPEGRFVTTHLVVNRSFLTKNRELVKKILAAHIAVTQLINADKTASGRILNAELKKETGKGLGDEVVARAMGRVEFTWDPIASSLYKSADAAHQVGFIRAKPNLEKIYDLQPLEEVLKEKNLPALVQK